MSYDNWKTRCENHPAKAIADCAACGDEIYDYEHDTCNICGEDIHDTCQVRCAKCRQRGCKACMVKAEGEWFCGDDCKEKFFEE